MTFDPNHPQFDRGQNAHGNQPNFGPHQWRYGQQSNPQLSPPRSKRHLWFGAGGLAIGFALGVGLVGGVIGINAAAEASAEAEKAELIPAAYQTCALDSVDGAVLSSDQLSVDFSGAGTYSGPDFTDVHCFGTALGMPDSVSSRMGQTRALDGTQSAEWDVFSVSWTYHPDDGLGAVFEYVPES